MRKLTPIIAAIIVVIIFPQIKSKTVEIIDEKEKQELIKNVIENTAEETSHYLNVQFICQAPLETAENWELHEESCEEAAFLQALNYQKNQSITKEEANTEILNMITWQEENFGGHYDLYAEDMKKFINQYQGIPLDQIRIINTPTVEDIQKEISNDKVVIAGVTAELLENKFYNYPGYHMLAIIGFDENNFITNDNGTRRGENYIYERTRFMSALIDAENKVIVLDI